MEQEIRKINEDEVREALKWMENRKAVGPDESMILDSEKMPEEWSECVLVLVFKNKGDVQSCSSYSGMKMWERVVEAGLRDEVVICEQQYGFIPRQSTDTMFALRMQIKKNREGQKELN